MAQCKCCFDQLAANRRPLVGKTYRRKPCTLPTLVDLTQAIVFEQVSLSGMGVALLTGAGSIFAVIVAPTRGIL
jgi:hypothetical protein